MKNIYIIGSGMFSRECYQWLLDIIKIDDQIIFSGFLAIENNLADFLYLKNYYFGNYENYNFNSSDYVIIAIADKDIRERIYYELKEQGANFYNLIHPTVILGAWL